MDGVMASSNIDLGEAMRTVLHSLEYSIAFLEEQVADVDEHAMNIQPAKLPSCLRRGGRRFGERGRAVVSTISRG